MSYLESQLKKYENDPVSIACRAIYGFEYETINLLNATGETGSTGTKYIDEYGNSVDTINITKELENHGINVDGKVKSLFDKTDTKATVETLATLASYFNCDIEIKLVKRN